MKNQKTYLTLFFSMLSISAFTFGGGAAGGIIRLIFGM